MKLYWPKTGLVLASNIKFARSFRERLIGLMFQEKMRGFDALILDPANSIHNCFVRFPIDALFVDRQYRVVGILRNFKPWRFSRIYFKSRKVIELAAGSLPDDIGIGDTVEVRDV